MTNDGDETIADDTNIIATDDAESSTETIIERSSGKVASADGGDDDQVIIMSADEFPSPAPVFILNLMIAIAALSGQR